MKKILILDKKVGKNLQRLTKYLQIGSDSQYVAKPYEDVQFYCNGKTVEMKVDGEDITKYCLVYFRKVLSKNFPIVYTIHKYLEKQKIAVVEGRYTDLILTSNKLAQTVQLALNNIPVPKTVYINSSKISYKIVKDMFTQIGSKPIIMKSISSHRGINNFRISSIKEILNISKEIKDEFIFQEYIPNNFDYRLLVLGDSVQVAEIRRRVDDSSHLNNISQGAEELFIPVASINLQIQKIAVKAAKLFNLNIAGVDIIISKETGIPYVLEVNAAPAFTYTDSSPEFPAIRNYFENIIK